MNLSVFQKSLDEASASARQVGGNHYRSKSVQPWEAMQAWMSPERFAGFLQGNVIKYIARYQDKGGVEDLKKLVHYAQKLIEVESADCERGNPKLP